MDAGFDARQLHQNYLSLLKNSSMNWLRSSRGVGFICIDNLKGKFDYVQKDFLASVADSFYYLFYMYYICLY